MFHAQEFLIRLAEDKASVREIPNEAALIANPHASHAVSGDVGPATPGIHACRRRTEDAGQNGGERKEVPHRQTPAGTKKSRPY